MQFVFSRSLTLVRNIQQLRGMLIISGEEAGQSRYRMLLDVFIPLDPFKEDGSTGSTGSASYEPVGHNEEVSLEKMMSQTEPY